MYFKHMTNLLLGTGLDDCSSVELDVGKLWAELSVLLDFVESVTDSDGFDVKPLLFFAS